MLKVSHAALLDLTALMPLKQNIADLSNENEVLRSSIRNNVSIIVSDLAVSLLRA